MNSRERLICSLKHIEPDRIPLDSGGCSTTTISAVAYNNLKQYLGINNEPIAVYEVIQQLAMPENWYLDKFEIDVVDATWQYCQDTSGWSDWRLNNGALAKIPPWIHLEKQDGDWLFKDNDGDTLALMPQEGHFFDQTFWPLLGAEASEYNKPGSYFSKNMWASMSRPLMDRSSDPDFPKLLGEYAKKLFETTNYALLLNAGVSLFETAQYLCRTDQFLIDLLVDRKKIELLLDRLLEISLNRLDILLEATNPYIQVIKVNDDLGMQTGPIISPKIFREVIKPRHKIIYDFIHKKQPDAFIFLHSCGSIKPFLPDLIDIGLDIINPVQWTAANMDPVELKKEYGKDLTFWGGGVDTQTVLPWKTPQEVADDVKKNIELFAKDGGFVFSHIHNISPEVPPQNIVAMFESFRRYRDY